MKTPAAAPVSRARREIVGPAVDLACPELFVMMGLLIRRESSKPQLWLIAERSYSGGEGSSRAAGAPTPAAESQLEGARQPLDRGLAPEG
jgi:hypothetical protein